MFKRNGLQKIVAIFQKFSVKNKNSIFQAVRSVKIFSDGIQTQV